MNWYRQATSERNSKSEKNLGLNRLFSGIVVNVEYPAGTERIGVDKNGKEWRRKMKYDYGFIYSAIGADGEGLDVYLGPNDKSKKVYIVRQVKPDSGRYDEDKVMMGFDNENDAKKNYLVHYDSDKYFGSISEMSLEEFKKAINSDGDERVHWKHKKKASSDGLVKTAAGKGSYGYAEEVEHDDGLQKRWHVTFGDPQRNVNDAYMIQVVKTKTKYKISVSVDVWNGHQSQLVWQDFWRFDLKQEKEASKHFDLFKKKCMEIIDEFVYEEAPTSMLHSYIRAELRKINGNVARTNNPIINYSYDVPYEKDWRSLIYGTRYPSPSDPGSSSTGY